MMKTNRTAIRVSTASFFLALGIVLAVGGAGGAQAKGKPPSNEPPPAVWGEPEIVFVVSNRDSRGLGVADLNGNYKILVDMPGIDFNTPTWLPDGSGLLFYSDRWGQGIHYASFSYGYDENGDINPDTIQLGAIQLVRASLANGTDLPSASPIWSTGPCTGAPDESCKIFQLLFGDRPSLEATYHHLFMARMEIPLSGGAPAIGPETLLTPPPDNTVSWPSDFDASWSYDGTRVVARTHLVYGPDGCQELCSGSDDIVVIEDIWDPFSTRLSLIREVEGSTVGRYAGSPRWANTQYRIAVQAAHTPDGGYMDLYILDLDGSSVNITDSADYEYLLPSWSPDDTQLVYRKRGTSRACGDKSNNSATVLETRFTPLEDGNSCLGETLVEFPDRYPWPNRPHWLAPTAAIDIADWPY